MKQSDLRIAFLTGTLQLGGSTTFLCNLGGELIRRGVDCRIFCGDNLHPLRRDFEARGISVSLHDHERIIFEDRVATVLDELRGYEANVVVATLAPFAFEVLRYLPSGVLRLAMVQSDDPVVYRTVEKYAKWMDGVIGVSRVIVERLSELEAFRNVPKHYLPYGVPVPERANPRGRTIDPLRILYLGRVINEQKRVHLFPQIAVGLEQAGVRFEWTIAGDGLDRGSLEKEMTRLNNASVTFIGAVNYAETKRLFDAHDIFILVSDYEGLPLSLLEAMAHGLVPIVSDLESGIREVVNEMTGVLVSVNRVEDYARSIQHLDAHRDEVIAKSAAARDRVATEYSVGAMTERWLRILEIRKQAIDWTTNIHVRDVLIDPQKWKYAAPIRSIRRLVKNLREESDG